MTILYPSTRGVWYVWVEHRVRGLLPILREHLEDGVVANPPRQAIPGPTSRGILVLVSGATHQQLLSWLRRVTSDARLRGAEFWFKSQEQIEEESRDVLLPHTRAQRATRKGR